MCFVFLHAEVFIADGLSVWEGKRMHICLMLGMGVSPPLWFMLGEYSTSELYPFVPKSLI